MTSHIDGLKQTGSLMPESEEGRAVALGNLPRPPALAISASVAAIQPPLPTLAGSYNMAAPGVVSSRTGSGLGKIGCKTMTKQPRASVQEVSIRTEVACWAIWLAARSL